MMLHDLTADEFDALTELTNIGMGRAGAKLSEVFESKVKLSIPKVEVVTESKLIDLIGMFGERVDPVNVVQQEFIGEAKGYSTVLFGGSTLDTLMEFLGYEKIEAQSMAIRKEILCELSNIINSASLSGLAEELELDVHSSQPAIILLESTSSKVDPARLLHSDEDSPILLIDIKLELEEKGIHCDNLIAISQDGVTNLISSLRKLME